LVCRERAVSPPDGLLRTDHLSAEQPLAVATYTPETGSFVTAPSSGASANSRSRLKIQWRRRGGDANATRFRPDFPAEPLHAPHLRKCAAPRKTRALCRSNARQTLAVQVWTRRRQRATPRPRQSLHSLQLAVEHHRCRSDRRSADR